MGNDAIHREFAGKPVLRSDDLIQRLVEGEATGLDELWDRFGARLLGYAAARLGGDEELAEDVMVQSLAAAVKCAHRFDPRKSSFAAWIYGITRRLVQAEVRRQRRRKSVPPSAQVPLEVIPDALAGVDHSDLASRIDARRQVQVLASALLQAEMEVLVLHFVDEFSVKEIAQITGRSFRSADSLLYRAKEKARERLKQDDN